MSEHTCSIRSTFFRTTNDLDFWMAMVGYETKEKLYPRQYTTAAGRQKYAFGCYGFKRDFGNAVGGAENYSLDDYIQGFCKLIQPILPPYEAILLLEVGHNDILGDVYAQCAVVTSSEIRYASSLQQAEQEARAMLENPCFKIDW